MPPTPNPHSATMSQSTRMTTFDMYGNEAFSDKDNGLKEESKKQKQAKLQKPTGYQNPCDLLVPDEHVLSDFTHNYQQHIMFNDLSTPNTASHMMDLIESVKEARQLLAQASQHREYSVIYQIQSMVALEN
ncbi:hypothetical protein Moror_15684 [Moniliophthora roreri MCA 2997]|uniref:Uncharacterized protein n=1 Tax=Moniliophthora roreri (strain MCA 2997) TaxID=1381753 RepID=V2XPV6_MONRO|nr:hypothetical protein Moror_15684 [Moniliophthora roreri MCA 2997]